MYTTEGIVLKKIDSGEANAFFIIYTKDFGKIRALAQGVKKEGAKLKGHLEPLNLVSIGFVLGKNGERLTQAILMDSWPSIRGDYDKLAAASYIAELVDSHCLLGEKDEPLWSFLCDSLRSLEDQDGSFKGNFTVFLDEFERNLLGRLGYEGAESIGVLGASIARPF